VPLQQICPTVRVSHSQLPSAPLVTGMVLAALNGRRMRTPTPADCGILTREG
jgi:triacylglycerol lipase